MGDRTPNPPSGPSRRLSDDAPRWRTGHLMRILLRQTSLRTSEALAEHGYGDLRPMHMLVIERLFLSEVRATELTETIGLTKQATGQILDRMEDLGYIRRIPDPNDGRAKVLQLTERGQRAARTLRSIANENEAEWVSTLGQTRHQQLRAALGSLIAATQH
jgi:DNA-binding MarR family transcriptional regulator